MDELDDGVGVWCALGVLWGARRPLLLVLFSTAALLRLGYNVAATTAGTLLASPAHCSLNPTDITPRATCDTPATLAVQPFFGYALFPGKTQGSGLKDALDKTVIGMERGVEATTNIVTLLQRSSSETNSLLMQDLVREVGDAMNETSHELKSFGCRVSSGLNRQVAPVEQFRKKCSSSTLTVW